MSSTSLVVIVYIIGVVLGAFFLDIWSSDTSPYKALLGLLWTAIFIICLFFADKNKE
tara:strand:- start:222 stop:392 length:171 start_codon:yes stop_codon:yes gene_type:complete